MKKRIDVHSGEIVAGQGAVVLKSDAPNACLIIAAHDPTQKVGALAHAMFASGHPAHPSPVLRDARNAIDEMVKDMALLGSHPENIEVTVVAGENVRHFPEDQTYHRSISEVLEALKERRLRLRNDLTEEIGAAHLALDVESGQIVCE